MIILIYSNDYNFYKNTKKSQMSKISIDYIKFIIYSLKGGIN